MRRLCLLVLLCSALFGCSDNTDDLRIGSNRWLGYGPLYVADDLRWLEPSGFRLLEYPSSSGVLRAFRNGLLDAAILWRNERERAQPLQTLIDAFELKTAASLRQLDGETPAMAAMPLSIGHITVACALGYLDYRFDTLDWRALAPRLAEWESGLRLRPSFQLTEPVDG